MSLVATFVRFCFRKGILPLLFILPCFVGKVSYAQITITSALVLPVETLVYRGIHLYPGATIDIGNPGFNIWDFHSLANEDLDTINFINPQLTPYKAKFSSATICVANKDGFTYFRKTASGLFLVGSALDFIGNGTLLAVRAVPDLTYIPFNSTYQTAYNNSAVFSETLAADDLNASNYDSILIVGNLNTNVLFDAYGTLITPFDTMQVIRQKIVEELSYTVRGTKYLAGQVLYTNLLASESTTELRYLWWSDSSGFNFPVVDMEVSLSGIVGSVQFAVSMNVRVGSDFITTCWDSCDTEAYILGANSSLSYVWSDSDSQITDTVKTLCAGKYQVTVTDTNGAFVRIPFTVSNATKITAVLQGSGASCETCNDGGVVITLSGGTGPYEILWDANAAFQTTPVASDLVPGPYLISVLDNNKCQAFFSAVVGLFTGVKVYPNPVDDVIEVLSRIDGDMKFEIYDLKGSLVRTFIYTESDVSLGVTTLPEGHYIYRVLDETGSELKTDHFSIIRP